MLIVKTEITRGLRLLGVRLWLLVGGLVRKMAEIVHVLLLVIDGGRTGLD
jgi:hypothetical protein